MTAALALVCDGASAFFQPSATCDNELNDIDQQQAGAALLYQLPPPSSSFLLVLLNRSRP